MQSTSRDNCKTVTEVDDLTLHVDTPDQNTVDMTVFNYGPTNAAPPNLTLTGFQQHVTLSGGSVCSSSGTVVTCHLPEIAATADGAGTCSPTTTPLPCDEITLTLQSGWVQSRLTVKLTDYYADPDPSNNTAVAFPNAPPAPIATTSKPTTPGSHPRPSTSSTSGSTSGRPGPGPSASPSAPTTATTDGQPTTLSAASPRPFRSPYSSRAAAEGQQPGSWWSRRSASCSSSAAARLA